VSHNYYNKVISRLLLYTDYTKHLNKITLQELHFRVFMYILKEQTENCETHITNERGSCVLYIKTRVRMGASEAAEIKLI